MRELIGILFCYSEIKKLPYFEDEVPEDCLNKWTANYKKYKSDMSKALNNEDREAKNEAAKEVIKDYKKVVVVQFMLFYCQYHNFLFFLIR